MNNLIYIPATNGLDKKLPYGIKTWEFYCKKYGIELHVSTESMPSNSEIYKNDNFQQYFIPTLSQKQFDRVLIVDCDTMVRWDTPNIFETYPSHTFSVVRDISGESSGKYHLDQWLNFNPNIKTPPRDYFNSGVMLLNKNNYLALKKGIIPYYEYYIKAKRNNTPRIDTSDQTPTNILAHELFPDEINYLDNFWNNMVMFRYDDFSFAEHSYIWHFTGPRMGGWGNKDKLMKQLYLHLQDYYSTI